LGHAFSIHGVSGNVGWAIAPIFMAGVTSALGWHVAGFGAAALGTAVFTTLCLRRRALADVEGLVTSRVTTDEAHQRSGHFAFLASGAVWLSFAFFLLTTMAFGILQNFAPAILSHVYGVSLIVASSGLTAYLLGSGTGMLAAGFLKDGADRIVPPALGFAAVMAAVLASGQMPSVVLWPLMASIGFGVGFAGAWPRPVGASRGDEPLRPQLVRSGVRVRLFGSRYRAGTVAARVRACPRRRSFSTAAHRHRCIAGRSIAHALRVSSSVRSVEPLGVSTPRSGPETRRAEAP
jgi:hypothetical protein